MGHTLQVTSSYQEMSISAVSLVKEFQTFLPEKKSFASV